MKIIKNKKISIKVYRVLFIIWSLVILTLTSIPKLQIPTEHIVSLDKLAHFGVYLIFAWLFIRMHQTKNPGATLKKLILLSLTVPLFDELHQIPIPGRMFSVWDVIADFIGFLAIIIIYKIKFQTAKKTD